MMLRVSDGWGKVLLPDALARKYASAAQESVWQGFSPSSIAGETDKLAPRDGTT
jgi:hypothetical protein